ncbi:37963_t:CDS:2, partial [Gigaspora margarita]
SDDNTLVRVQNNIVPRWNSTYNAWVQMLKLKPYIEILASSLTVQQEKDAIANRKCLKTIMITEDKWTTNALLKEFEDEDDSTDEPTDFNSLINDRINIFDNEKISDKDEDAEEFESLAITTDLIKSIKKIMSKLFEKYYDKGTSLACQDYLNLEYDRITSDKDLESLSNKIMLDLSGLFISTVFITVQKNLINKNGVNQYFIIEMIGPLDNLLQWWAAHKNTLLKLA